MAMAIGGHSLRLAIVGDVHDDWDPIIDSRALKVLQPDLVLFTGDFGDENVPVVSDISRLHYPKAAILGNHDCWWTAGSFSSRNNSNPGHGNAVQAQLDLLGTAHVGYSRADFPALHLSVIGGRPGSGGGAHIGSSSLAKKLWNIKNMKQSTERIVSQALAAPAEHALVFLAHNGPTGLGSSPSDICGKDWTEGGGDHGDPDLESALSHVKSVGKRKVPLVIFGHMHKELQRQMGDRKMIVVGEDKSVYLNAAVVPRIRSVKAETSRAPLIGDSATSLKDKVVSAVTSLKDQFGISSWLQEPGFGGLPSERNFTVVDLVDGEPTKISEVWVTVAETEDCIGERTLLYRKK